MKPELADSHAAPASCLNCNATVSGNYCHNCGQETRTHAPSLAEFAHEFIGHYVALEGALAATLRLLLLRPGRLSADYLAGRRTRYIQPLRLYLTISVLFFALMKILAPAAVPETTPSAAPPILVSSGVPAADGASFESWLRVHAPALAAKGDSFDQASSAQKNKMVAAAFFKYGPYILFGMLPFYGVFLKLLYWRSRYHYGEHLVFAMHLNAFALIAIGALVALPWAPVTVALLAWLSSYVPLAMRRTYGGGLVATLVRASALLLGMLLCVVAVALASALAGMLVS